MASQVYSTRFYSEKEWSGSLVLLVPAGVVYVIRDVTIYAGSQPFGSQGAVTTDTGATLFTWDVVALSTGLFTLQHRWVFEPGQQFDVNVTTGNADITASGYVLTLP